MNKQKNNVNNLLAAKSNSPQPGTLLNRYPNCVRGHGEKVSAVQARVRQFSTLHELDSKDTEDAFWLGHSLGRVYGVAIQCARQELDAFGKKCEAPPVEPLSVTCPGENFESQAA